MRNKIPFMANSLRQFSSESSGDGSENTVKKREKLIFVTELLRDLNSKIPVEQVIAFEEFLEKTVTNERIEDAVNRHRFEGSPEAYRDSMEKVATEDFDSEGANIRALMEIHDEIYRFSKSVEFRRRVQAIVDASMDAESLPEASNAPLFRVLGEIENSHIDEIPVEKIEQYTMKNMHDRLAMWESRLASDPLYQGLKIAKSQETAQE